MARMEEMQSASSCWDRVLPWRANEPRVTEESVAEATSPVSIVFDSNEPTFKLPS